MFLAPCPSITALTPWLDNVLKALSVPILPENLAYGPYDPRNAPEATPVSADGFMAYSFPEGAVLRPVRMEVHDRSDIRGEVPARVCLLESNGTTLRTFALPSHAT